MHSLNIYSGAECCHAGLGWAEHMSQQTVGWTEHMLSRRKVGQQPRTPAQRCILSLLLTQLILVTPSHVTQLCRYQMFTLTKYDKTGQHDL